MRHLQIFNTVKVLSGTEMSKSELERIKYSGFLTLSQSGDSKYLVDGIKMATKLGVTCINVVNTEDSPITRVISEIADEESGPNEVSLTRSASGTFNLNLASQTSTTIPNA